MEINIDDINYKIVSFKKLDNTNFSFTDLSGTNYKVNTERKTITNKVPVSYVHLFFIFKDPIEFSTDMTLNDYQNSAKRFANYESLYTKEGTEMPWGYLALGISGEAGEITEKFKKAIRNNNGILTEDSRQKIKQELGDIYWYVSEIARQLGFTLEEVVKSNILKLEDRLARGVINSEGDDR